MKSDTENFTKGDNIYQKQNKFYYSHPRPLLTVDNIIYIKNTKKILLIKRKNDPFKGYWALPGGYMEMHEKISGAALRELKEETGLSLSNLKFFKYFDTVKRDPRDRTITFVFYDVLDEEVKVYAASDSKETKWLEIKAIKKLAFDHGKILNEFLTYLKEQHR
ncbi:MAG: NUDIX hydrolase [Candidatus Aureabacteria bacterium]|nr:NUDIX hydrolase [Candidatus Auribacterota bacterium]